MKAKRKYSIFLKKEGRWIRDTYSDGSPLGAYEKQTAIRLFQNRMLSYSFSGVSFELRPVQAKVITDATV